jgi:hypothetical protein
MRLKTIGILAFPLLLATLTISSCGEKKQRSHDAAQYETIVVGKKDMSLPVLFVIFQTIEERMKQRFHR